MATRVLIAGVSARGFAESAARAGYEVRAVDGFGDLDLRACCRDVAVARTRQGRFSIDRATQEAQRLPCDAVAYVASFENHPHAVRALARHGTLWGNPPAALRRARDPLRFAQAFAALPLVPAVRLTAPHGPSRTRWLVKPRASGGGSGIAPWRRGQRVPAGSYLQQRIAGIPGSIVFAADGRRFVTLGISRLLVGDRAFGAGGFRYCGNIMWRTEREVLTLAAWIAEAAIKAFGLVGVNGIDFVVRGRKPYPVEVNPRYPASAELVERASGLSIFDVHAAACTGRLAPFYPKVGRVGWSEEAIGKAIVYAKRDVVIGDTRSWLADESVRDVPVPGQRIMRGQPVCTVLARGEDDESCYAALVRRADRIYRAIEGRDLRIA